MAEIIICERCRAETIVGHSGPFTPDEWRLLHPVAEQPAEPDTRPPELIAAEQAMQDAQRDYDEANAVWIKHQRRISRPHSKEEYRLAEPRAQEASRIRDEYEARLRKAKSAYYGLSHKLALEAQRRDLEESRRLQEARISARKNGRRESILGEILPARLKG